MNAQQTLNSGLRRFGAATAKMAQQAFDHAWIGVAHQYAESSDGGERAQALLAECVLAVVRDGDTDVEQIARLALMMFGVLEK